MRFCTGLFLFFLLILFSLQYNVGYTTDDVVTVDFTMAEKAVDWLDFIKTDPGDEAIKDYFFKNVAPTGGCQSIIKHWARFMDWDNEKLYKFIMEGLGRIPSDQPLKNDDGSLSYFGRRKMLWQGAIKNTDVLRDDIKKLKMLNLVDTAKILAKICLPDDAKIDNDFYFVLFGGSSAYSIGKENGFDILQLPKKTDGSIYIEDVLLTLAHEMNHSGFNSSSKVELPDDLRLLGLLAAEGMPTYFINKPTEKIEEFRETGDPLLVDLAALWESYIKRMPEIYAEGERDIELSVKSEIDRDKVWDRWMMGGLQGQAYALGSNMYSVIDKYLGVDSAKIVAYDNRQLIRLYNKAAKIGNKSGGNYYTFSDELVDKVINYSE